MTKNIRTIIIMAAGILLLVLALVALSCDSCADDGGLLSGSDIPLLSGSDHSHLSSELTGMHLEYNESGELLAEGEELEYLRLTSGKGDYLIRYEGEEPVIESLSGLRLDKDFVDMAWYNAMSFGYSYTMHAGEGAEINLADFGLDPAALTIECKYTNGTSCRLFVGNEVTGSPSIYYFIMEGHDEVYLGQFDASFFQGDGYWLSEDIFGDDTEEVSIGTIKLTGSRFPEETALRPHTSGDKSDPYYGCKYIFTQPFTGRADDYLVTLLTDELTELVADSVLHAFPTDEEIAACGLDRPYAVVTHQRNGKEKVLRLAAKDATTLYAMADGVDCIFQLSADTMYMLAGLAPDQLRSPDIHVRYFDAVETIRITAGDEDYTFRLGRTPLETDNTLYEYRAYYGDTQLTLNHYKNLLQVFNSAAAVSYGGGRESDTPALTVTITYFEGFEAEQDIISYYPAGTRRYAVEINGQTGAIVGQMWVDQLLDSARLLSRDEAVTP